MENIYRYWLWRCYVRSGQRGEGRGQGRPPVVWVEKKQMLWCALVKEKTFLHKSHDWAVSHPVPRGARLTAAQAIFLWITCKVCRSSLLTRLTGMWSSGVPGGEHTSQWLVSWGLRPLRSCTSTLNCKNQTHGILLLVFVCECQKCLWCHYVLFVF